MLSSLSYFFFFFVHFAQTILYKTHSLGSAKGLATITYFLPFTTAIVCGNLFSDRLLVDIFAVGLTTAGVAMAPTGGDFCIKLGKQALKTKWKLCKNLKQVKFFVKHLAYVLLASIVNCGAKF